MSTYTVRYAHLAPDTKKWKSGDIISPSELIAKMGNSGQSTATHLHIDCVQGAPPIYYSQKDIESGRVRVGIRQLIYFLDSGLFGVPLHFTTNFADIDYFEKRKKVHMGYDVVPENRHKTKENYDIYWNRSMRGIVVFSGVQKHYGGVLLVSFEA